MTRKQRIIAVVVFAACCTILLAIIHNWPRLHHWYIRTDYSLSRSYIKGVKATAQSLERSHTPPTAAGTDIHIDFNSWGDPIIYQWENGRAVIRAAGKDKVLNTDDDIIRPINIRKE